MQNNALIESTSLSTSCTLHRDHGKGKKLVFWLFEKDSSFSTKYLQNLPNSGYIFKSVERKVPTR